MNYDYRFCSDCKRYRIHGSSNQKNWHCLNSIRHTLEESPLVLCDDCNLPIDIARGVYRFAGYSHHPACWRQMRSVLVERITGEVA